MRLPAVVRRRLPWACFAGCLGLTAALSVQTVARANNQAATAIKYGAALSVQTVARANNQAATAIKYGDHVALQGAHGRFVVAESGGTLKADREKVGAWESFQVLGSKAELHGGKAVQYGDTVSMLSSYHYRFMQGDPKGNAAANGQAALAWERITLVKPDGSTGGEIHCNDTVVLRSSSGKYFAAERGPGFLAKADRTAIGAWEKFEVHCVGAPDPVPVVVVRSGPCGSGQFEDARNGGECWSCPAGSNRTVHAVDSDKACETVTPEQLTSAQGPFDHPGDGRFWDIATFKYWKCPDGYDRTANWIKGNEACSAPAKTTNHSASHHGKSRTCNAGDVWDSGSGGGGFYQYMWHWWDPEHEASRGFCATCPPGYAYGKGKCTPK